MRRALHIALHLLPFGLTLLCVAWVAVQSPFAAPFVQKSTAQIEASLTRAIARKVDAEWLVPRLQDAVAQEDLTRIELFVDLAIEHGVAVPPELKTAALGVVEAQSGYVATALSCGACAFDITACQSVAQIGACAVPFELTPAGDVNALRRAGVDYVAGDAVDRLDLGLAIVGLGATGAVLATGGTSYTLKAASSLLRMARRLGTVTGPFAARLTRLVGDAVHWDRMGDLAAFRIAPAEMIDAAKLGELTDIAASLQRVAANTSVAEAVTLLRHVDTVEDAARLARVTDAIGPKTRRAFEVLGKTRVLRATVRLSDLAITAAVAIYALAMQILVFCAQQCGNACLRGARRLVKPKLRVPPRGRI